jgi:hypothetical protein
LSNKVNPPRTFSHPDSLFDWRHIWRSVPQVRVLRARATARSISRSWSRSLMVSRLS